MNNKKNNNENKNPSYTHSASVNGLKSKEAMNNYSKSRAYSFNDINELVKLQEQMLNTLKIETIRKKDQIGVLQTDIQRLRQTIDVRNFISSDDIEKLKTEIRILTNKKAELELKIRHNSGWKCSKCTFINQEECLKCSVCSYDRDEIWLCSYCQTKNLLTSTSCKNCNATDYDEGNIIIDWPEDSS